MYGSFHPVRESMLPLESLKLLGLTDEAHQRQASSALGLVLA